MNIAKKKIVVTQPMDLLPDQIEKLKELGELVKYDELASSHDEWLERVKDADIVFTGKYGLKQKIYELKDKFIVVPFVGTGWVDKEELKERGITFSYSPGCNKDAVAEWIVAMMLMLSRKLNKYVRIENLPKEFPPRTPGLSNKTVCILGKGNIGTRVGEICEALNMKLEYFRRGDNLIKSVKDADFVVNALSLNPSTEGLLDKNFFMSLKKGSYFVTPTGQKINDIDAVIEALDKGILAGIGIDGGGMQPGDTNDEFYKKMLAHPKILVTPHIAFNTDRTARVGNDMVLENIEAWLEGKPKNIIF